MAPKSACGGPCIQKSASMPPNAYQDTTQSLWDPTLGVPRAPRVWQNPTWPFSAVLGVNLAGRTAPPCAEPSCGDPDTALQGSLFPKKVLQSLLNHTKTPHNHYGTLPGGPHGTLGPAKSKKIANCTRFQGLKKNTSRCNPQRPQNRTKIEITIK